jgi:hypothetical protein
MAWDHQSVYDALVARREREEIKVDTYVAIYSPQPRGQTCAILYRADSRYARSPLHLHTWSMPPRKHAQRTPWRDDVFEKIRDAIECTTAGKDGSEGFSRYRVPKEAWSIIAEAVGLKSEALSLT